MATLNLDPQLAAALARVKEIDASLPPPAPGVAGVRANAAAGREWWNEGGPTMAECRHATIPGPYRPIPVVLYRPVAQEAGIAALLPVYVFLHGGAYRIGNEWSNDRQMRELAASWGGAVISADYAQVPEQVFPVAIEETQAVYQWLHQHGAEWGLDGTRIAFGGASAGANVSTGAAIGLGGVETGYLKAGLCVVGVFDRDLDTASMREFGDAGVFPSPAAIAGSAQDYLPDPATHNDPRATPVAAEPALFPPMFLAAAEIDVLRDSSKRLSTRLAAGGVPHRLKIYPGMTHLFFSYTKMVEQARQCVADMAAFLAEHLPAPR
jgi:acetyl esterase